MNEITIILVAVAMAFILFNQLAILGQIRVLHGLFKHLNTHLGESTSTSPSPNESRPSVTSRRIKFRARTTSPGTIQINGLDHSVVVEDISQTGAMIRCEKRVTLKINYEYPFQTTLPTEETIRAVLKIIRIVDAQEMRYGGCFVNLSMAERKILTKYVNRSASEELQQDIPTDSTHKHL